MTRFDGLMGKLGKLPQTEESTDHASEQPQQSATERTNRKRRGKRNDPNYTQVTAYIKKDTHHQVKIALLQEGGDREFSELIEELLVEYLRTQQRGNSST